MNILILGSSSHGKDELAKILNKNFGLKCKSSSKEALDIFLYDILVNDYCLDYSSHEEAFNDRNNYRNIWHKEISLYNKDNPTRLAQHILIDSNVYVGMRCVDEINECKRKGMFDLYLGIYNPRVPIEDKSSNSIDMFEHAEACVLNNGNLDELELNVIRMFNGLLNPMLK
jgi:outer membrane protein assembly factor BamB